MYKLRNFFMQNPWDLSVNACFQFYKTRNPHDLNEYLPKSKIDQKENA